MQLLVIRHGIAGDRQEFAQSGKPDGLRPLTSQGRKKMRKNARGIRALVPELSVIVSSPLTRAVETAKIVSSRYDGLKIVQIPALSPRKPVSQILDWLRQHGDAGVVALVGHEPQLGAFVGWMLTGLKESFIDFKKGGAVMLELNDGLKAGHAKLAWCLKPSQLREIGEK